MSWRLTARSRLALLYTGLVLAAGSPLTVMTYLLLFRSLRLHVDEAMFKLLTRAAPALLVVAALAGMTGWLAAGRMLRPIRTISGTANRLSAETLSERIPVREPPNTGGAETLVISGLRPCPHATRGPPSHQRRTSLPTQDHQS